MRLLVSACSFFSDKVEKCVDQEGDWRVERFCRRVTASKDLEYVEDGVSEVLRQVWVEVCDVEEELESFRQGH